MLIPFAVNPVVSIHKSYKLSGCNANTDIPCYCLTIILFAMDYFDAKIFFFIFT